MRSDGAANLVGGVRRGDPADGIKCSTVRRSGIVSIDHVSNYWELPVPLRRMSGKDSGVGGVDGRHALTAPCDLETATFRVT
jgi:hypothetical protein